MPQAVIQRVSSASVTVDGERVAEIGEGMLILLGIGRDDDKAAVDRLAEKVRKLRIFDDESGRPNLPLGDREVLCVSQFTLYADLRKGNRPSYVNAAPPELAKPLYEHFCQRLGAKRGVFGASMKVASVNEGPFTLLIGDASQLY